MEEELRISEQDGVEWQSLQMAIAMISDYRIHMYKNRKLGGLITEPELTIKQIRNTGKHLIEYADKLEAITQ